MYNRVRRWQKIDNRIIIVSILLIIIPLIYRFIYKKKKDRESEKVFINENITHFIANRNNATPLMINDSVWFDSSDYKIETGKHKISFYYTIDSKGFDKIKMQIFSLQRIQNDNSLKQLTGVYKNLLVKFIYNNSNGNVIGTITVDSDLYKRYNFSKTRKLDNDKTT